MRVVQVNTRDAAGTVTSTMNVEMDEASATAVELADRGHEAIAGLRQITQTTGTLTGLQLSNAVRLLARACIVLIRLRVGRLESLD